MSDRLHDISQFAGLKISRAVLDGLHDGVILADSSGQILYSNAAARIFQETTQYSKDKNGQPVPLDAQPLQRALRAEPVNSELFYVRPSITAAPIWVEITALACDGGAIVYCRNVTDRLHAEKSEEQAKAAIQLQSRFRMLLETAPDGILEVAPDGTVVMVNSAIENLFGYKREELIGKNVDILVPAAMRSGHGKHRADYSKTPQTRPMGIGMELAACRKDGTEFSVEVSLSPVHSSEGHHVTAIVRDVTERKRISERLRSLELQFTQELEQKNRQLELRNQEVERANSLKSEFLASVSHELRSPLHTIIGFADLLGEEKNGKLNEKQKRFINNIHKDSEHLLAIINDLLDISKIEAGRLELHIEPLDIIPVAEEVLSNFRSQALQKGIALESYLRPGITIEADSLRFKQILYNLLSNAVKFTGPEGRVTLTSDVRDNMVQVAISDTGTGIAAEDLEAIFDKFYQSGSTTRGVREGTGLGLAISRNLVERMGGSIWVESVIGQGSRFVFTIPLLAAAHAAQLTVLLAEGEDQTGDLLANFLESSGFKVLRASFLIEALQMAKQLQPDAIILDIVRPHAAGRFLREQKALPETQHIPVIVAGVLDNDEGVNSLGADAYLTKPVSKKHLLETLRRLTVHARTNGSPSN